VASEVTRVTQVTETSVSEKQETGILQGNLEWNGALRCSRKRADDGLELREDYAEIARYGRRREGRTNRRGFRDFGRRTSAFILPDAFRVVDLSVSIRRHLWTRAIIKRVRGGAGQL